MRDGRVRHEFAAERLNQLWLADIPEHKTGAGKLYVCVIKDVLSNKIVGERMKAGLSVRALCSAVALRGDVAGCIIHNDRGSQCRSRGFLRALARHHLVGSMGKVASCGDNAAMESLFSLLQNNVLDRRSWTTREQLHIEIVTSIERTDHRRRRQTTLDRLALSDSNSS